MKIIFSILMLLITSTCYATQVVIPTTWSVNDSVTNTKLNGINNAFAAVINGGLDDTNADTTNGSHFFKTVAALPAAGSQGKVYFLTADNTLNLDTGSSFIKSISTNTTSPVAGDVIYYNGSAWTDLSPGTSTSLLSSGTSPSWGYTVGTSANNIVQLNSGASLPSVDASLLTGLTATVSSIKDYGTSTSTSTTRLQANVKFAFGHDISVTGGGNVVITNLPFTSSASYIFVATMSSTTTGGNACPSVNCNDNSYSAMISVKNSGSQATVYKGGNTYGATFDWYAIGI